jgi:hypothetical protein
MSFCLWQNFGRNWHAGVNFAYTHAPIERKSQMLHMAERASPEQLSEFYERLSGDLIGSGKDALLLMLNSTLGPL